MGLSYKMQEFFEVWGMSAFDNYTLALSIIMNAFEIVAGVAVLIGWRMRLFSWLLLLLIVFFTFLTGFAVFSGKIKTCGCFGDCIPLAPIQSFYKDLILLVLILVIFIRRKTIQPLFRGFLGTSIVSLTLLFCFVAQWYVLNHLPVLDCLPYKKGNNLVEQMKVPEGALPDSFVMTFKYIKNGKELEFDADHMPEDLDSSYKFVDRIDKLVRPATGIPKITDFILYGESGTDTTGAILAQQSQYVMLLMKDAATAEKSWSANATAVSAVCAEKNIPFFVVTATTDVAQKALPKSQSIQYLKCDATVIKTAARVNPTYFIMNGAVVKSKIANADYEKVIKQLK